MAQRARCVARCCATRHMPCPLSVPLTTAHRPSEVTSNPLTNADTTQHLRTNKEFNGKVVKSCYADPRHKLLMPYSPNAPRNRPKQQVGGLNDADGSMR